MNFDGGVRPNPGPTAVGCIVETNHWSDKGSEHIGEASKYRAEYHALIRGLEVVSEESCIEVEARGDIQLVVKQIRGECGLNKPELRPLRNRAQDLADEFETFEDSTSHDNKTERLIHWWSKSSTTRWVGLSKGYILKYPM